MVAPPEQLDQVGWKKEKKKRDTLCFKPFFKLPGILTNILRYPNFRWMEVSIDCLFVCLPLQLAEDLQLKRRFRGCDRLSNLQCFRLKYMMPTWDPITLPSPFSLAYPLIPACISFTCPITTLSIFHFKWKFQWLLTFY
jgi:hypothetical protein